MITYPHPTGRKYRVTCQKHAAYTDNMASPCCCAVQMHKFSTKSLIDRHTGPVALKDLDDFAHGTHFSGEFLREWYHTSLVVDNTGENVRSPGTEN